MNVGVQILEIMILFVFDNYLEMGFPPERVMLLKHFFFFGGGILHIASVATISFLIPPALSIVPLSPQSHQYFVFLCYSSQPNKCVVMSQCSFDCIYLMIGDVDCLVMYLLTISMSSLDKCI